MQWITRSHVHVDRVACPWLITRFVDSEAEFLFVPRNQIEKVAKETGAIPFDAPGVELGHKDGRCSFESIILKYELKDPDFGKEGRRRKGFFVSIGGTKGPKMFEGAVLTVKYFFDVLNAEYAGELLVREVDAKGDILKHPESLRQAFEAGRRLVKPS